MKNNLLKKISGWKLPIIVILEFISLILILYLFFLSESGKTQFFLTLSIKKIIISLILFCSVLTIVIFLYLKFSIFNSIHDLKIAEKKMESDNLNSLTSSLAELARGNLASKNSYLANPIKIKTTQEIEDLINLYNSIFNHIRDCINEFNNIVSEPCKRLLYVGADSFREGEKSGKIMGKILNGKGNVAILLANFNVLGQNLRRKGFQSYLLKNYPNINVIEILEHHEKIEECYQKVLLLLKERSDLDGIYLCEGTTPSGAARAVLDSNKSGRIKLIVHDLADETMKYLTLGTISATLSQDPFAQGYEPIIYLYNYLINKEKPVINRLLTSIQEVTISNYKEYWDKNNSSFISTEARKRLVSPIENTNSKKFKIAVILPDDKIFWAPVAGGVKEAENILSK